MNKQRKTAKIETEKQLYQRKHRRDQNGRIVLHMTVKDDKDFLSVFSTGETPVIDADVARFIEESTFSVLPSEPLTLCIHSHCIDDCEKEDYRHAIKEYYTERYIRNQREMNRNKGIASVLALGGIVILALAFFIEQYSGNVFWTELVDIIAWAFLWEAVDIRAFKNRKLRIQKSRYLSFLSMDIEYRS